MEVESLLLPLVAEHRFTRADVNLTYASFLRQVGRINEALTFTEQAYRLDPLSLDTNTAYAATFLAKGDWDEADRFTLQAIELSGGRGGLLPVLYWGAGYLRSGPQGWYERAIETLPEVSEAPSDDYNRRMAELLVEPDKELVLQELNAIIDNPQTPAAYLTTQVQYLTMNGFYEEAIELMQRPNVGLQSLVWFPVNTELRTNPGIKQVLADAGLVDYWQASGNWADYCRPLDDNDFECF